MVVSIILFRAGLQKVVLVIWVIPLTKMILKTSRKNYPVISPHNITLSADKLSNQCKFITSLDDYGDLKKFENQTKSHFYTTKKELPADKEVDRALRLSYKINHKRGKYLASL